MELSNGYSVNRHGSAMVIRFTRPEIRNPLSVGLLEALIGVLSTIPDEVASVIFTGSGNVFASGADLREIADVDGSNAAAFARHGQTLMDLIALARVGTIAAVNGYCYGGALDLALACQTRIAGVNAEFCHPGASLGIMTGWGGTQRLTKLVGEAVALEMFLSGKRLSPDEAMRVRLVGSIADDPLEAAIAPYL